VKLSELKSVIDQIIAEHGDVEVAVLGEDGMNESDIQFVIEDADSVITAIICDPWTADQLEEIEGALDDATDEDDVLN
jgi:hypothetical protein